MTGVSSPVSLCRSDSRKSSRVRVLSGDLSMRAFSVARCSRVLSIKLEERMDVSRMSFQGVQAQEWMREDNTGARA